MCGIVYVQRKDNKPAHKQVLKRYKAQKTRGTDGYGYIGIKQSGRITDTHRFMFEHAMSTKLLDTKLSTVLFHHRYPTSTPNVPEAAHPIRVTHDELKYDYYVVHNGVINNDEVLKEKHEKLGYKYTTQLSCQLRTRKGQVYDDGILWNDSEAFAIELARNIEGITGQCEARGSIAYIVLQVDKQTQVAQALYYGTNGGNPLTLEVHKDFIAIASEGAEAINNNVCYRMELPSGNITEYLQVQTISSYVPKAGFGANHRSDIPVRSSYDWSSGYDDMPAPRTPKKRKSDDDKTLHELEEELASIDDEIIGTVGDINFAESQGDLEEADMHRDEYQELMVRRNKTEELYARQANRSAATKR